MREQRAEAVILVGGAVATATYTERMTRLARSLNDAGSRLVMCGRPSLGADVPETVVEYDNSEGAFAMTSYLLSAGHERIAYLGAIDRLTTATERLDGHRRALAARAVDIDPELIVKGPFSRSFGYEATRDLVARKIPFTAIFAATDMIAAGVLQALREARIRVPADVSVVGYDDIPLAIDVVPALTTVHIPHEELGRTAVRMALHREENVTSQRAVLGTHVVVRDSVQSITTDQLARRPQPGSA
jgi:LacI family transcriptional regulator